EGDGRLLGPAPDDTGEVADPPQRRSAAGVAARHDLDARGLESGAFAGMQAVGDRRDRLAIAPRPEAREELAPEPGVVAPVEGAEDPRGPPGHRRPSRGRVDVARPIAPAVRRRPRPGGVRPMPGPSRRQVSDAVAVASQVVAAAPALATAGLPAE